MYKLNPIEAMIGNGYVPCFHILSFTGYSKKTLLLYKIPSPQQQKKKYTPNTHNTLKTHTHNHTPHTHQFIVTNEMNTHTLTQKQCHSREIGIDRYDTSEWLR